MKLLVQEFLETHSFKELQEQHGVYASFSKSGHKWSLNYDQIEAKEIDPIAQESRGLILSAEDGRSFTAQAVEVNGRLNYDHITPGKTRILAYPMKRFFNHGQGSAANIDWSDKNLTVLEKMDGTLCIVYFDPFTDKWSVATRSVPEADLPMDNGIFTFRSLFEKALTETSKLSFDEYAKMLNRTATYCFELTTPYNRIVVFYPENRVTLLAARLIDYDLPEYDLHKMGISDFWGVPIVQTYTLESVEKTLEWVASLNPMEHEGVVVKQGENRIKVKNPAYVAYNKVRDSMASSERNMVEIILAEKDDDVIPMLPEELVKNLQKIKIGLQKTIRFHDELYDTITLTMKTINLSDKKSFALAVQAASKEKPNSVWQAPFFQMFDGKATSMKDFIAKNRKDGSWGSSFLDKLLELSKAA